MEHCIAIQVWSYLALDNDDDDDDSSASARSCQLRWLTLCASFADMAHIVKTLKEFGLCSAVHYKEMYIPESEISGELHHCASRLKDSLNIC